ncbi:GPR1/FUN34/yaaH family-domain-containing protein [Mrakia frigida]|uniref:acetate uptake transporter family protein n=1 Tax=Mrakia frigida TaxID=29902 RepID=UPI003FCC0ED5
MSAALEQSSSNNSVDPSHAEKRQIGQYEAGPLRPMVTPHGHPVDTSQPGFPVYHRKFADPAPLGLFSFGITTFVNSMYVLNARGITNPNVVISLALSVGGLNTILAGMWEFACGNTFAATTFTSYGGFYLSFAIALLPASGVQASYLLDPSTGTMLKGLALLKGYAEVGNAISIWLFSWMIMSFIFVLGSFKSNACLVGMFVCVFFQFMFQAIGYMNYVDHLVNGSDKWFHVAGWFGLGTAFLAFYVAFAALISPVGMTYFRIPVWQLGGKKAEKEGH